MHLRTCATKSARLFLLLSWALGALAASPLRAAEHETAADVLAGAAESDQFTFVLFWKNNDELTHSMGKALDDMASHYEGRAVATSIQIGGKDDQEIVKKYNVSRFPMPLIVSIAPNGAVTGYFQKTFTSENVAKALVTPTMTLCMKSMQGGKIVLVCAQPTESTTIPKGARELHNDPDFRERTVVVRLVTSDPAEARFLKELKIDAQDPSLQTAILAPPGVLVGKFPASASKDDMAAKLHAAGKCCDDENCKHNKKASK